ncbi:MAG: phage tail protein [Candidatus Thiodiazotropha taylori]|uniref:Phage tail protein n=1 Tax=Candidatus Thiodiazotropha taylori TaxID=2792791 RepID=A0A9E4K885_9GAMM|nr:phage tail protein [Candidatus Thiodiazotropha taylori]MCW4255041.1 phage tail protein [Candidatus Thiodiazotropha taylori]
MATLRIDDFKAALAQGGARANQFRATVFWPNAEIAGDANTNFGGEPLQSFMIKTAQLPGSTINPIEVPFRGRMLKVSGDRMFEDVTMTVTNDNNFAVRNAFERWHDAINGNVVNVSGRGTSAASFDTYTGTVEIEQLDRGGEPVKRYRLFGAWPNAVDPIEVGYDNGEIEEFGVTFSYQWWESDTIDVTTSGNFPAPPSPTST